MNLESKENRAPGEKKDVSERKWLQCRHGEGWEWRGRQRRERQEPDDLKTCKGCGLDPHGNR